jgi:prepilin-type N-terminal cleavage/methylation domain-containing protein
MKKLYQAGFTMVEILMTLVIAGVMVGVLFTVTFNYYANAVQSQETAFLALESQTALSQMVDDIRLSAGVGASTALTDANAPVGGWATSDTNNVLIVRYPALAAAQEIIYDPSTGYPYRNEFIYFVNGANLYKRTLKNTSATGNVVVTSCPTAATGCPADRLFSKNISNFSFTFYDVNNAVTTDPTLARSVRLQVDLSKKVFGRTISLSNTTQVTQRNQ